MKRTSNPFRGLLVILMVTLFVCMLSFPAAAEAYTIRSSGTSAYGVARSQPVSSYYPAPVQPIPTQPAPVQPTPTQPTPSQPTPPPSQPAPAPQPSAPAPQPSVSSVNLNTQEKLLFDLVNSERIKRGLRPLQLNSRLTQLARLKSQDMIRYNYFSHLSPTYGRAGDMLRSAGIPFRLVGENLGTGGNIRTIFSAFMNSSGHRSKIIDARYTQTGVGIVYQPGRGYLVTQLFLQPR
jgi:uncharacterized protein YkwD